MIKDIKNILIGGGSRTSKVKKNVMGSILIKGVSIAVSVFIVPITLGYVDKEVYGIWLTLSSIVIWLNFFDIGFTPGLQNKLTEAIALDRWDDAKQMVSSTYAILFLIFIPVMFVAYLIIPWIDWCGILNVSDVYKRDIILTMYPLVTCFCLEMILKSITTVLNAYQMTAFSTSFTVFAHFISLIIIIFLPYIANPSLFALSLAISSTPIAVLLLASIVLYSRKFRQLRPSYKCVDFGVAKNIFHLGGKFFIIQVQGIIVFQTANILISNVSSPVDVSVYNIAYKYLYTAMMAYSIFMGPLWPAFTDAYTKKDYQWMQKSYYKMCCLCGLTIAAFIILVIFSPIVYKLWIGDKVIVPMMMTILVAVYLSFHSWRMLQDTLINGIGKIKLSTYMSCFGLIFFIPLALCLGRIWGAYGVIGAMIAINSIYSFIYTIQLNMLIKDRAIGIWNK